MPEYPIRDSIITSLNAQEPWPDNVKLFQPYEVEQILLPDNASCLAVQAFLKMCNLPFEVEMRWNAEFMSPSGRVPFIKCGAFVVSELEPIAQFAANKGVSLCNRLTTEEKAEMRAYMSLITNVLVNAELYISWIDDATFNQVTKVRNSSVYPWPLGWLQTRAKRNSVAKRLKALHWHDKNLDQVMADVEQCCNSLSQRLGDKDYFFGTFTQLDALVYGHIRALLSARGPKAALMIRPITNALLQLVIRVAKLVNMKLTSQEEYLLKQACIARRHISPLRPVSEKYGRSRLSKMSVRRSSGDSAHAMNVFGFKPFASKKIIIMTSEEGTLTCKYDEKGMYGDTSYIGEEEYNLVIEIVEDIVDKVEDIIFDNHRLPKNNDKNSFEILAFPNQIAESNNESYYKLDDSLEPLRDNDIITECSISFDATYEDVIHVINEDPERDSDLDDDKHVFSDDGTHDKTSERTDADATSNDIIEINQTFLEPRSPSTDITDSSKNHCPDSQEISGGEQDSVKEVKSSSTMRLSSESKTTMKFPSDGEMSVESLLSYLKKRSALPTELDALVFGHVFTIITTRLPCRRLADTVRKHEVLLALAKRVDEQYFKRP